MGHFVVGEMVGFKLEGLDVGFIDGKGDGHFVGSIVVGANVSLEWVGISVLGETVGFGPVGFNDGSIVVGPSFGI